MDYIDSKYIGILGVRLEQFKKKGKALWNFRCPYCGDSQKDKLKARGYLFENKGDVLYKCHNCGIATGLTQLIDHVAPPLKKEYVLEKFSTRGAGKKISLGAGDQTAFFKTNKTPVFETNPLKHITCLELCDINHPARLYVHERKIPQRQWKRLYYTETFKAWTNSIVKNKFKDIDKDEGRLIIPFFDKKGKMVAFQGRSLDPNNPVRYITIKITEDECKLFGMELMDESKPVYVTEGPIDSLFLDNAIAMAGSDLSNSCNLNSETEFVIVMDNENRNKEIVKKIGAFIERGYAVCIWDEKILQKDINDMVLSGMSIENLHNSIKTRTFKGLQAKMALNKWKRV
jgi:DNA-directed RNA polymerase subunit RPC12/RpoP